jgi:beta-1,4-mannosyltransferase
MPPIVVASFPPAIRENPYQRLLYEHLETHGFEPALRPRFKLGWLWRHRGGRVGILHFHWPQAYYRHEKGPTRLRLPLSWLRLGLFVQRLLTARLLGYRLLWTVHQLYPHETRSQRLDRAAAAALARASHSLIVHDRFTYDRVLDALPSVARKLAVVPHGSYVGVYPGGRSREEVRRELGITASAVAFLCFGHLRGYKNLDLLLDAFRRVAATDAVLVVAGLPLDEGAEHLVRGAAATDGRVRPLLRFVPDSQVAELFGACDVGVFPRGDGGTSGALILALSLGLPVVAAEQPGYLELTGHGLAGWHFEPGNGASLEVALQDCARDQRAREDKARAALAAARALRWEDTAAKTAALMRPDGT